MIPISEKNDLIYYCNYFLSISKEMPLDINYSFSPWVTQAKKIILSEIPEPYKTLLAEKDILTPKLEIYHDDTIILEKVDEYQSSEKLIRKIILRLKRDKKIVELGAIRIHWKQLNTAIQKKVIEAKQAFGSILKASSMPYKTGEKVFFQVSSKDLYPSNYFTQKYHILYGRTHKILNKENKLIAESSEILI